MKKRRKQIIATIMYFIGIALMLTCCISLGKLGIEAWMCGIGIMVGTLVFVGSDYLRE